MNINIRSGDLVHFIHDLSFSNFTPLIRKKGFDFIFTSSQEYLKAYYDEDKLDKVIYNILSNAFKYTEDNGTISVSLQTKEQGSYTYAIVKISDTGVGIDKEELTRIFTPFYINKHKLVTETNGIGLSLAKNLIELMYGTISVESEKGKGSIFTLEFPIDKEFFSTIDYTESDYSSHSSYLSPEKGIQMSVNDLESSLTECLEAKPTLLVVEDNEELRSVIKTLLSSQYNILTANDGLDALSILQENEIELIISDVMMPNMDGWQLCQLVKENIETSDIPIVLLTAKIGVDNQIESYNAGADGYISKPFETKLLIALVNNFLMNKSRRQREFRHSIPLNIETLESASLDKDFLHNIIKYIEENISDIDLNIDDLAEHSCLSRSTFYRKIKNLTNQSPIEFIRNIRLKYASSLLIEEASNISEIAYSVGFNDPKYFSRCFKAEFGVSPSEYSKSFQVRNEEGCR